MKTDTRVFDLPRIKTAGIQEIHPLDGALLLMHFAFRGLVLKADVFLKRHDLSRLHHRILYVLARVEGVSVGGLQDILGVTKQALHRPLKHLQDQGYVVAERHAEQHRVKVLRLTQAGMKLERKASDYERNAIEKALGGVTPEQQQAWYEVMTALARQA